MTGTPLHSRTIPLIRLPGPDEPCDFTVAPDRVDLWLVHRPAGAGADALARTELDDRERARADAFIRSSNALLYTAAHVALRRLIAGYTAGRPEEVRFMRESCPGCGETHGRRRSLRRPRRCTSRFRTAEEWH
ncbi:hypothetical protein ACFQ10_53835 [Streptomyces indonesiensis]